MAYFHVMENTPTIVIHPTDPTTTFLKGIYKNLPNKMVITGGITKLQLRKHIKADPAPRVICCGHGSSSGLFGVNQFPDGPYIIDHSIVESLRNKTNIFIWLNPSFLCFIFPIEYPHASRITNYL